MPRIRMKRKEDAQGLSLKDGLSILEGSAASDALPKSPKVSLTETVKTSPKETAFGRHSGEGVYALEPGGICPHCHYGILEEDASFSGTPCEFFVYCPTCNAHICTYKPMPHQEAFHKDTHMKKLYAGGFGSAKTYTCGMEFLATCLQIPGTQALMGAAKWSQVADTCLKFVCDNLPKALVARCSQDKVNWNMTLVNGSRISAKALDDEGKIRSANLSLIWVEEASEVEWAVVAYIAARLRNKVGWHKGRNRLKMLLSSNPDVGWLAEEWLMSSDAIYYHGDVKDRYEVRPERRDPAISTHISATSANVYLPPDYEETLARNKEDWWVNRYLKGSFKYSEGLVYPNFSDWFCEPFAIPAHWKRVTGTDFGRRDPTAHVVGALDPVNKVIYVYAELEEPLNDRPASEIVAKIRKMHDFSDYLLAFPHQCDPRGRNKDQVSGQSWIDTFREGGLTMVPAKDCEGDSLAPTINKLYTYAKNGRLRIFSTCRRLYDELSKYKYKAHELGDHSNSGEKPLDKHNHLPDALRYMLSPFPNFPPDPASFDDVWRATMIERSLSNGANRHYNYLSSDDGDADSITDVTDLFG